MRIIKKDFLCVKEVSALLERGELVCFPTDTLYGLLGNPFNEKALNSVYKLKKRDREKPLILLFPSLERMEELGIELKFKNLLLKVFPAPLTVVLPLKEESPLRKLFNRNDVAVRIPDDEILLEVLNAVSPLFAPSANLQGMPPATSCEECRKYFKGGVALCVEGRVKNSPSTLIDLTSDTPKVLREGAYPVSKLKEVFG